MQANVKVASAMEVRIAALADRCVKCGLCLPHCPTYRLAATEAESPRGRIAFAQALAEGKLERTPSILAHLDNCLACMACERVCPSKVQYGELIATTRAWLADTGAQTRPARVLGWLLAKPRLLGMMLRMANLPGLRQALQGRVIRALLRPFGMDRMLAELPRLPRVQVAPSRIPAAPRGRIGLFLGCVAASVDRDVHAAATSLLHALGFEVVLPRGQGCCGALALHNGDAVQANSLGSALRAAFEGAGVETVLVSASGCFGTLRDHVFADSKLRVREVHEFLSADSGFDTLKFRALPERIAVHAPCTQRNVARADGAIARLLARIPQLQIDALPAPPGCCGAAGDYFLHHSENADALRAQTLDAALAFQPEKLVTSNVGCRIFLGNGLRECAAEVSVIHPLVLLTRQLEN
ncbi:MAG TPA: (Fe-S)-binding protein [Rudaea sp.]|nr:(Fe-S)-binding protein [Rudaea sp.]